MSSAKNISVQRLGRRPVSNCIGFYYSNDTVAQCIAGQQCGYMTGNFPKYRENRVTTYHIHSILTSSDFVANGTTVRNGTTLYRYETNGSTSLSNASTLSATVLVDKGGFIHNLSGTAHQDGRTSATATRQNERTSATATFDYSFSVVSHPPTKPNWINSCPRLQFRTNASEVTFEHTGGPPLPKGTNISVGLSNQTVRVQLPKSLGRGDVAHFTITDINETTYETTTNITVNRPIASESVINFANTVEWVSYSTKHWVVGLHRNHETKNHRTKHSTNSTTTTDTPDTTTTTNATTVTTTAR